MILKKGTAVATGQAGSPPCNADREEVLISLVSQSMKIK
jgi:hypothetical protein